MPKGSAGIPALQLEVLNKLISKFDRAPSMFFTGLFPAVQAESDTIKWEIEYGSAGMTPFVAPGSVAPAIGTDGIGEGSAKAAFYKEKMYFDEVFLNNMREPGTYATYQSAERKLTRGTKKLRYRIDRRREWMMSQMLLNGTLSYTQQSGTKFSLSYGIPDSHMITLAIADKWGTGVDRDPLRDIFDAKTLLADDAGVTPDYAIVNSELLKTLILDAKIQALLQKNTFGDGDLFTNPASVVGTLLGVGTLMVYDELYEIDTDLTGPVTGGTTTVIPVADTSDMEVGAKLRFIDVSEPNTWEDTVIDSVDHSAGTVTVVTAPVNSYIAGEDKVQMRKKFIDDNTFMLFSTTSADGDNIAEFMESPYGLGRRWGTYADTKEEWDPEGLWLRIQDKGLPVMYHPDTIVRITVR